MTGGLETGERGECSVDFKCSKIWLIVNVQILGRFRDDLPIGSRSCDER